MLNSGLYLVATPIGNIKDISMRAIETLQYADVIACEDTRVTKKLFNLLNIKTDKPFISYQDYSEEEKSQSVIDIVNQGKSVALVSDAGSPLISDPGYKLVRKCREQNIAVHTIPGACAVISALQLSGIATNRFMFAGFIPNKDKARKDTFLKLKNIDTTLVFYETANRLLKTLNIISEVFGAREISVARELTKLHEECLTGTVDQIIEHFSSNEPRGELVLIIAPPSEEELIPEINVDVLLRQELKNTTLKTAVKNISERYGLSKKDVYEQALKIKNE